MNRARSSNNMRNMPDGMLRSTNIEDNTRVPTVAFIDDGINTALRDGTGEAPITETHGDICYRIFQKHVKVPYNMISLKTLNDETGTGNIDETVSALNWCAENGVDIISMSMGTRQFSDFARIAEAVDRLRNIIIVAACSNANTLTLPACLPSVIGVRHCGNKKLISSFAYINKPYDNIDVLMYVDDELKCNSTSVPIITARVCGYFFYGHKDTNGVRIMLEKEALKDISFLDYRFYRSLLPLWEEIVVPVVLVTNVSREAAIKLKDLIIFYTNEDYRAVGLTLSIGTDAASHVFNISDTGLTPRVSLPELIELYYNFTLPDIVFLHMGLEDIRLLPNNMQPDVVVGAGGLDIGNDVRLLYERINGCLSRF